MKYGEEKNNIEVKHKDKKCCFRYLEDNEIDTIIRNRIAETPKRGGTRNGGWTESELALRNSVILDLICNKGISRTEAQKILMQRWDIGKSTASRYVLAALEELVDDYDEFADYTREQHIQRLEALLEECLSHNSDRDRKNAIAVLDSLAKIYGLNQDNKNIKLSSDESISFEFQ